MAAPTDATAASVVAYTGYDFSEPEVVGANTGTGKPSGPAPGTPFGNTNYKRYGCYPQTTSMEWTTSMECTVATARLGTSDYRIRADGSPMTRDIPHFNNYCRYYFRPIYCRNLPTLFQLKFA